MSQVYQRYNDERDILDRSESILTWKITWGDPKDLDVVAPTYIVPKFALRYATWWVAIHLGPLGLDESNSSDGEMLVSH